LALTFFGSFFPMSDIVLQKNIGALIDVKSLSGVLSWTAGGGSDSATFTGTVIDRAGFAGGQLMPLGADVDIAYGATLGSGKTLSIYLDLQDSPDGSNFSDYATEAATVVATGPSGGGTVAGVMRMVIPTTNAPSGTPGVDLNAARRYARLLIVPHLSATATDTAVIAAVGVFAGYDRLAAPTS
jgi:hypothetical protein